MIDERGLRVPVVGEASEVRDDEGDVRDIPRPASPPRTPRLASRHRGLAHDSGGQLRQISRVIRTVVTMDLDAYGEPEFAGRCLADHGDINAALVGQRMNEGKAEKALGMACNDPCHFSVGVKISFRKRGKYYGSVDAGGACSLKVFVERSGRVGRLGEPIAFSGVTMAVDNHGAPRLLPSAPVDRSRAAAAISFTRRRARSCCRGATSGRSSLPR